MTLRHPPRPAAFAALCTALLAPAWAAAPAFTLSGWAAIPSAHLTAGPVSGQFSGPANGVTPPYAGQPIPGFSGMLPTLRPGVYLGLPDNGFGTQGNSADFVLGFYRVRPHWKRQGDGRRTPGGVSVGQHVPFSDPRGLLDASHILGGPVYRRSTYYPTSALAVDARIRDGRLLTGADFDVESIARMNDGSYWVGEEFGPYLLHFNGRGELIDAPVRHPVLRAPQNPQNPPDNPANLPSSRGFESLARNLDGSRLYVTTEASIASEPDKRLLRIDEFDPARKAYTGRSFTYAKDSSDALTGGSGNATNVFVLGDMTAVGANRFVVIERDDFQGPPDGDHPPRQKKLYLIDLDMTDADSGVLKKCQLVDLLHIPDPRGIGGAQPGVPAGEFSFPLQSVESVTPVGTHTLMVGLDNNYPGGNGRNPGTPDDTELITLRSARPLWALRVEDCGG